MNMMIADISRKPTHYGTRFHIAGGFQRCFIIGPAGFVIEANARKVVLGVKQIRSNSMRDKVRDDLAQQQPHPAEKISNRRQDREVQNKSDQAVVVLPW